MQQLNPYTWYLQSESVQQSRKLIWFSYIIPYEDVLKGKSTYRKHRAAIWPQRTDQSLKRPVVYRANGEKVTSNWCEPLYHALIGTEDGPERNT